MILENGRTLCPGAILAMPEGIQQHILLPRGTIPYGATAVLCGAVWRGVCGDGASVERSKLGVKTRSFLGNVRFSHRFTIFAFWRLGQKQYEFHVDRKMCRYVMAIIQDIVRKQVTPRTSAAFALSFEGQSRNGCGI